MSLLLLLGLPALAFAPNDTVDVGIEPERIQRQHLERQAELRHSAPWQAFTEGEGQGWRARFDEWTGVPFRAWGAGIPMGDVSNAVSVEAEARRFLQRNQELFGVGADQLALGKVGYVADTDMWFLRFDQQVPASIDQGDLGEDLGDDIVVGAQALQGQVPVYRSGIELRIKQGKLIMVGGKTVPQAAKVAVDPTLTGSQAIIEAIVQGPHPGASHEIEGAELTILPLMGEDGLQSRLTWQVRTATGGAGGGASHPSFDSGEPVGIWVSFIDAATGELLSVHNEVRFIAGTIYAEHDDRTVTGSFLQSPMPHLEIVTESLRDNADADGVYSIDSTNPEATLTGRYFSVRNQAGSNAALEWDNGDVVWTDADATQAELSSYIFLNEVREWSALYASDLSFTTDAMRSNVNLNSACNAYYDGDVNFYAAGSNCNNTGRIADVNYHEWGHGFHYYSLQSGSFDGSLSEGVGDTVSHFVNIMKGESDSNIIAPYFQTNGSGIRNVDNDMQYPEDYVNDDNYVHSNGTIFGGAVWDLRLAFEDTYGEAAGYDEAARLFALGIRGGPNVSESYDEFVAADDDNGDLSDGTPNLCDIIDAFALHGLGPSGGLSLVAVEHEPLDNQSAAAAAYEVSAEVYNSAPECSDATIASGLVNYSVDAGDSYDDVALSLSGEDLTGDIPAVETGSVVHYFIEAETTEGEDFTSPSGGSINPFSFFVGELEEIYCESFEDDDGGYTHALLSGDDDEGADDWQHGRPNGLGGDPDFAADGTKVWGNDLGEGNYNGEYQNDKTNRLTSVPIAIPDAGYEKVVVQFQRWLNVEDGYYDKARVYVDEEVAWTNHATKSSNGEEHHQDNQWALHTLVVPEATYAEDGEIQLGWEIESDRGLSMGGWNIDQVCVYGYSPGGAGTGGDEGGDDGGGDDGGVGGGGSGELDGTGGIEVSSCGGCTTGGGAGSTGGALAGLLLALGALVRRRED